jgi:hypothetical protein
MTHISKMGVEDVYFLIKRLGADCDDYQQYRELTQNGIDAVIRARASGLLGPGEGEVVWDVDWYTVEDRGVYRACVSDNGDGMSADDLARYINRLSASGGVQSLVDNYGVGAKIAAATRNPAGLVYRAFQDHRGVLAQLVIDDANRAVGFQRWQDGDEWLDIVDPLNEDTCPDLVRSHGVSVTLLGTHEYDQTVMGPMRGATPYKTWWLFRTLNRRYYQLPVTVKVRVFHTWDPETWPKTKDMANSATLMREVFGQKHYLEKYKIASGVVQLSSASAHWYIMDSSKGKDQRQFYEVSGHIAALYQNELLEMRSGTSGRKLLQNFGAVFSANQVVIYVEPDADLGNLTTNTTRTDLVVDGKPLPWMEWADEFREQLPGEIKELEAEIATDSTASSHNETILQRLKKIMNLFKVTRYRPARLGSIEAEMATIGNAVRPEGTRHQKDGTGGSGGMKGGRAGAEYLATRKQGGTPADQLNTHSVGPVARWVSVQDGTREAGDFEDRAARYLAPQNLLLINSDFRVFADMVNHFEQSFSKVPGAKTVIEDVVREWFEQQLIEAVMGLRALEGSKLWTQDQLTAAMTEESMTAVVMPRWHTWNAIKQQLGRKLVGYEAPAVEA